MGPGGKEVTEYLYRRHGEVKSRQEGACSDDKDDDDCDDIIL